MLALLIHALLVAYECILLIRVFPSVVTADALTEGIRWAFRAKKAVAAAMTTAAEWCDLAVANARAGCEAAACERRANAPVEETARAVAGKETAGGHAAPDAGQQGGAGWGRFLLEAPYELLCPITRDVMIDPLMAGDATVTSAALSRMVQSALSLSAHRRGATRCLLTLPVQPARTMCNPPQAMPRLAGVTSKRGSASRCSERRAASSTPTEHFGSFPTGLATSTTSALRATRRQSISIRRRRGPSLPRRHPGADCTNAAVGDRPSPRRARAGFRPARDPRAEFREGDGGWEHFAR